MTGTLTVTNQLKIAELIASGDLWIKNTTNPRKILLLTVIDRAGRTTSEPIPDTPHPIHLSNYITRDILESCQDLLRFARSGALEVIDPKKAEEYYKRNPMAAVAVQHAYGKISNRTQPISREAIAATDPNASKAADEKEQVGATKVDGNGVNVRVRAIVDNVKNNTITSDAAVMDLMNLELAAEDLQFVVNNATGHLREFAQTALKSY